MAAKRATETVGRGLLEEVQRWGGMKQTGVGLRHMMEFGSQPTERKLLLSAQFLHKELPIRIARRVVELDDLPFGLSEKHAVLKVVDAAFACDLLVPRFPFPFLGSLACGFPRRRWNLGEWSFSSLGISPPFLSSIFGRGFDFLEIDLFSGGFHLSVTSARSTLPESILMLSFGRFSRR